MGELYVTCTGHLPSGDAGWPDHLRSLSSIPLTVLTAIQVVKEGNDLAVRKVINPSSAFATQMFWYSCMWLNLLNL
jgi:hypothetical protein